MNWIIPIIIGIAGIFALFASKPERKKVAFFAAVLILTASILDGVLLYSRIQSQDASRQYAYEQLEQTTKNLLGLISHITVEASDDLVPNSEDDFFSLNTAKLICSYLDLNAKAPILPERTWIQWLSEQTIKAEQEFETVIRTYGADIPSELLQLIVEVKRSVLITFPRKIARLRHLDIVNQPQILGADLEKPVEDSLRSIKSLYKQVWKLTESEEFPMPSQSHNLKNRIGKSRFRSK
jgi:hypothetical protein